MFIKDNKKKEKNRGIKIMSTYAVGDIHGCFDEWMQLKNRIEAQDSEARFILVGDIIDRGSQVYEMLDWAMSNITSDGKYQMIMGNHEEEKILWLERYFEYKQERHTSISIHDMDLDNYNFHEMCVHHDLSDQQLMNILNWLKGLEYYKEVCVNMKKGKQRFMIVHAFLPVQCMNKDESFSKRSIRMCKDPIKAYTVEELRSEIVWFRNYYGYNFKKIIVVHGHTPTISSKCIVLGAEAGKVWYHKNDINIDCGLVFRDENAYKEANLAAVRLEDLEEIYLYENESPKEVNPRKIKAINSSMEHKQEMLKRRRKQENENDDFSNIDIDNIFK